MAGQRKEGTKRTEFHPDAEDREWLDEQADAAGMTRNEFLRRMLSDYRNGQAGKVTGDPGTPSEQVERMERNMDTLCRGLMAIAERQEAGLAAMAVMAERQEQRMLALAASVKRLEEQPPKVLTAKEPPALPEPKAPKPRTQRLATFEQRANALRPRYGDAAVDDMMRRLGL